MSKGVVTSHIEDLTWSDWRGISVFGTWEFEVEKVDEAGY